MSMLSRGWRSSGARFGDLLYVFPWLLLVAVAWALGVPFAIFCRLKDWWEE